MLKVSLIIPVSNFKNCLRKIFFLYLFISQNKYIVLTAVLRENADDLLSKEDVVEAVGVHIQSSIEGLSDEAIELVCEKLALLLHNG